MDYIIMIDFIVLMIAASSLALVALVEATRRSGRH
jgi:hypothetical protein